MEMGEAPRTQGEEQQQTEGGCLLGDAGVRTPILVECVANLATFGIWHVTLLVILFHLAQTLEARSNEAHSPSVQLWSWSEKANETSTGEGDEYDDCCSS
jgi:hypothetical protein